MNKTAQRKLRIIASELPNIEETVKVKNRYTGNHLLKKYGKDEAFAMVGGEDKFRLESVYVIQEVEHKKVDHFEKLKSVYTKKGLNGINEYKKEVRIKRDGLPKISKDDLIA